jgi:hypothetical protein
MKISKVEREMLTSVNYFRGGCHGHLVLGQSFWENLAKASKTIEGSIFLCNQVQISFTIPKFVRDRSALKTMQQKVMKSIISNKRSISKLTLSTGIQEYQ